MTTLSAVPTEPTETTNPQEETKKTQTTEERLTEIREQYGQLAFNAGNAHYIAEYQMATVAEIHVKMRNLNHEAEKLQKKLMKEKQTETQATQPTPETVQ